MLLDSIAEQYVTEWVSEKLSETKKKGGNFTRQWTRTGTLFLVKERKRELSEQGWTKKFYGRNFAFLVLGIHLDYK